jgi:hypothetical protein
MVGKDLARFHPSTFPVGCGLVLLAALLMIRTFASDAGMEGGDEC